MSQLPLLFHSLYHNYFIDNLFLLVLSIQLNYDINDFIFREVFQCLKKLKRALTGLA